MAEIIDERTMQANDRYKVILSRGMRKKIMMDLLFR